MGDRVGRRRPASADSIDSLSRTPRMVLIDPKRVELGRALALQPKVLLLDEPMAGVSAENVPELVERDDIVELGLDGEPMREEKRPRYEERLKFETDDFFLVLDGRDGAVLYRFNTGGAMNGGVVTYQVAGKQYVAATSGSATFFWRTPPGSATVIVFSLPTSGP